MALGAALVAALAAAASAAGVTDLEENVFLVFHDLPAWAAVGLLPVLQLGSPVAIGLASGLALFVRRVRLGVALAAAGSLGWLGNWAVGRSMSRPDAAEVIEAIAVRAPVDAIFPAVHVAVATALVTVVVPYVGRRLRRVLVWLAALVAAAALFAGTSMPLGVVVGAAVGWWAGSTVNLLVGAPGRRVGADLVTDVLVRAGLDVADVHHVRGRVWGTAEFRVTTTDGRSLAARVIRAGIRRLSVVDRVRRYLVSLELHDDARLDTPKHHVEHEAYVTLLAERAGVRVPSVALARELPGGAALTVTERVTGTDLRLVPREQLDDALVEDVLGQVALLHGARIAHHALWPEAVVVDDKGRSWITSFEVARSAATEEQLAQDVAELLVGLSTRIGAPRTVAAARRVLGEQRLAAALRELQPLALPRRVRAALRGHPEVLGAVRAEIAERARVELPPARLRVSPTTVLGLAVAGGAVYVLLPQIGSFEQLAGALRGAHGGWLTAVFVLGLATAPAAAVSYWGATHRPLPLGRATAVQLASAFTGRLTPAGVGGIGLNMIFLENSGLSRREAVSAATLNVAGGAVAHAILFVAAAGVLGLRTLRGGLEVPTGWPVLAAVLGVLVAAGAVLASPFGRRRLVRPAVETGRTLLVTLRHPVRATALLGGSAGVTFANALGFVAALEAFGGTQVSVLVAISVYVGGSAIGSAAPTPGGLGAVEAALVAALTGVGVTSGTAVAAVLTFRLLTFWAPIVPGIATYRLLQHHGVV